MWTRNQFCVLYQLPHWSIRDVRVRKYFKISSSPIRTAFGKRGEKALETVNYIWILDVFLTTFFTFDKLLNSSESGFIVFTLLIIIPMAAKSPGCPQFWGWGGRLVPNSEWQWRCQSALHSRVSSNIGSSLSRKPFPVTPAEPLSKPPGVTLTNIQGPVKVCTLNKDQQWDNKDTRNVIQLCAAAEGHVPASQGLTKCCPVEKGMANHFSILSLRTLWTVWKGKKIWHWKMCPPGW